MNKKLLVFIAAILVILSYYGMTTTFDKHPLSNDPFGAPPKGTSANCGPEDRYKFDVPIKSKDDFVNFIKNNEINQWATPNNFENIPPESVKVEKTGNRTIYSTEYTPSDCSPTQKFTLKMTNDGHVSMYGCCGK